MRAIVLVLLATTLSGCVYDTPVNFEYEVTPAVQPQHPTRPAGDGSVRPVAAVKDSEGNVSEFIANEILIRPGSRAELDAFLDRTGGTVVGSDALPDFSQMPGAPQNLPTMSAQEREATFYIVRVDPAALDTTDFEGDMGTILNEDASVRISSEEGAKLLALAARETNSGSTVSPNFVAYGDGEILPITASRDEPDGEGGFANYLLLFPWLDTGSRSHVSHAIQYLASRDEVGRVRVALIDGGFLYDEDGQPRHEGPGGETDYRLADGWSRPIQWDFAQNDDTADGENLARCTGGSRCPWHGQMVTMVSTGILNNEFGSAGSGGTVAVPMTFKTDLSHGQTMAAVRAARNLDADVVSMSFGGGCDNVFCEVYYNVIGYGDTFADAWDDGIFLLAAAGNDDSNAGSQYPCSFGAVFCVGALENRSNLRIGYSNYGDDVDLFAPTNLPYYTADDEGDIVRMNGGGTSASTPFTAGVVAMMRALDPSLNPNELRAILHSSANTDSPDPRVPRYLHALDALREITAYSFPPDSQEPNDVAGSAGEMITLAAGDNHFNDMTLDTPEDVDRYTFELPYYANLYHFTTFASNLSDVRTRLIKVGGGTRAPVRTVYNEWSNGREAQWDGLSPGRYVVEVSARGAERRREALYHLRLHLITLGNPTADAFEANNSAAFPHAFGDARGTWHATHHLTTDDDYYEFDVEEAIGADEFVFAIRSYDVPVLLALYQGGSQIYETNRSDITIRDAGTYQIRVRSESPDHNRYTFTAMGSVEPPEGTPDLFTPRLERLWRILWETGNIDFSVIRGAEYFLIPRGPKPNEMFFHNDVHARLYDMAGNLVRESTGGDDVQGFHLETLSLQGLADADHVLQITPLGFDAGTGLGGNMSMPEQPFSMSWPDFQ